MLGEARGSREVGLDEDIRTTGADDIQNLRGPAPAGRRLFPLRAGNAVIYVEALGDAAVIEQEASIRPVSAIDPGRAFAEACNFIHESFRGIGERLSDLGMAKPNKVEFEFNTPTSKSRAKPGSSPCSLPARLSRRRGSR